MINHTNQYIPIDLGAIADPHLYTAQFRGAASIVCLGCGFLPEGLGPYGPMAFGARSPGHLPMARTSGE